MKPKLNELAQLIRVDVERTRPEGYSKVFAKEDFMQALSRILLVWSGTHPSIGYFQGLNDLVCPILIVFLDYHAHTTNETTITEDYYLVGTVGDSAPQPFSSTVLALAEADTYWCISVVLDALNSYVEKSKCGVHGEGMLMELEALMKKVDAPLMAHFQKQGAELMHFAFRWMLCLFVREIHMDLLIPLWDFYICYSVNPLGDAKTESMPLNPIGFSRFHVYVCAAFLRGWSETVMKKEFMGIVQFLQNPPTADWGRTELETLVKNARCLMHAHKL